MVAARDSLAIGGPERRKRHGQQHSNEAKHTLRHSVTRHTCGAQNLRDHEVVGRVSDRANDLKHEEQQADVGDA